MTRWSQEWIRKTESRLQRAIYRAIRNYKSAADPEAIKRCTRILMHAEKLKWILVPFSKDLERTGEPEKADIEIKIKRTETP